MKLKTFTALIAISGSTVMGAYAAQPVVDPALAAVDSATAGTTGTAKEQIEAATKAYDKQNKEFMKKLRAEKDRKKAMEMYRTGRPSAAEAISLILKLAKETPKAEGIENGLMWALMRGAKPAQRKEVSGLLLTHYKDSESIGKLAQMYSRARTGGEAGLREIIEKSGDEKVRQGATYYLAEKLIGNAETKKEGLTMMKKLIATPGLDKDNPKLVAQGKGKIMIAEKLGIGCTAPDIVGTDQEGKEFKLSEYRGQVVLLDFWGIW
jgi:cytochrome oxidase Cu insertion factor (SCO1/SenC/PrrC family)